MAARRAGREPSSIRLLAVSKSATPAAVAAAVACGLAAFGENYLQEAQPKIAAVAALCPGAALEWHFIGPIQSNKTRPIAEHFGWVQSIDRLSIAERLSAQRPPEAPPLNVLLQVNISGEASKSGVDGEKLGPIAAAVAALPRLRLRGLMAIPAAQADPEAVRPDFRRLRALFDGLQESGFALDTLSIGMSADLEAAIAEGSTMVRIGTAIFGPRP